ncbi:MAG: hypothetical protein JO044_06290 [Mycobacteriaceae bacterium]|nr:hypothetical protein [Mycobacteriaceae bacterium]MBV9640126.1 hypothetical protein [Mycobacteriaceae bacterium]
MTSVRHTIGAVTIAAIIAGFGGAAIYAATDAASGPGGWGRPGPGGIHDAGGGGGPGSQAPAAALHGQFVVTDGHGGYATELTQTGVVTAVSDGSLTAKSADGFTQTYAVTPGTAPAVNEMVTIRGTLRDGSPTATAVDP